MLMGIHGRSNSGKDTAADFLTKYGFVKVALADPLKRIIREVYNFSDQQLWGPSENRNVPDQRYKRSECPLCGGRALHDECEGSGPTYLTPRYALQELGTGWGRDCYKDTWVELTIRTAREILMHPDSRYTQQLGFWREPESEGESIRGIVVPDVRYLNEFRAIRKAGGRMVRLVRPGSGLTGAYGEHDSENDMREIPDSEFDLILHNDGTLDDLRQKVETLLTQLTR
jgi:hypothetical protein